MNQPAHRRDTRSPRGRAVPPGNFWQRVRHRAVRFFHFHLIRLFRIRSTSEQVARGFALGLAVNFFPTFGFGVMISGFFARVLGGNLLAGLAGGALLAFFWPLLFYLNIRTGALVYPPPIIIDEMADVTEPVMNALTWGRTFVVGAIVNAAATAGAAYALSLLCYSRIRPHALRYLRRQARDHRLCFGESDDGASLRR